VEDSHFRKTLVEIINGCSTVFIDNKRAFIRHKKLSDIVDYELIYDNFLDLAKKRGMPTEEEILKEIFEAGFWAEEDDEKIEEKKLFIKNLKLTKDEMYLESVISKLTEQIEEEESELKILEEKKASLISSSAEKYAMNRANDYYICEAFYKDVDQKEKLFTQEEFEYLKEKELKAVIESYNIFSEQFSEESIQVLAVQDFYKTYYSFSETSSDFFGKPVVDLTNFQLHLLIYTKIFKNIFERHDNIPDNIRKNPKALLDYGKSKSAKEKVTEKFANKKSTMGSIVGATKDDYKDLGISSAAPTKDGDDLHSAAKANGGRLTMQDMMRMNGV
jgi:hypothetical protein